LYLGSKIDENGGTFLDIQQKINNARGAFARLKKSGEQATSNCISKLSCLTYV
jgi:hypothetical protein